MPAPSPADPSQHLAEFRITVNGKAIDTAVQVLSLDVRHGVNVMPVARLAIADGDPAAAAFPVSSSSTFTPGGVLDISLGYDGGLTRVFRGVIHRQGLEAGAGAPSRLIVEATDKAMVMTLARQNARFQKLTDSALCQQLIKAAGLTPKVAATTTRHELIVQYDATSWDLLLMRARLNGMVASVDDGEVTVARPDTAASPVLTLTYGDFILDMSLAMDASTQIAAAAIKSFAWDPTIQALAVSRAATADVTTPGDVTSAALAEVFNVSAYVQQTAGQLSVDALTDWSSGELARRLLGKITGELTFQGSALARVGSMIALAGLGDRFNGAAYISAVHHSVEEGNWLTSVEVGLDAEALSAQAPAASGQLPPVHGVQAGIVKQIDKDPDGDFRVQVTLPLLQAAGGAGVWARFGSFYASNGVGADAYPEIGDEVVLGFLNNDPCFPVVLGSLYSRKNPPPYPPDTHNSAKAFMTKSKLEVRFDETAKSIVITTPAKQSVEINDTAGAITLKDVNGNQLTLDSKGVSLSSAANFSITAAGSLTLSASADVSISAGNSLAAAGGTARLKAGGAMTISGATVSLNP